MGNSPHLTNFLFPERLSRAFFIFSFNFWCIRQIFYFTVLHAPGIALRRTSSLRETSCAQFSDQEFVQGARGRDRGAHRLDDDLRVSGRKLFRLCEIKLMVFVPSNSSKGKERFAPGGGPSSSLERLRNLVRNRASNPASSSSPMNQHFRNVFKSREAMEADSQRLLDHKLKELFPIKRK